MAVETRELAADVWVLASFQPSPGHGVLAVNAFVIGGDQPVLVDTGLAADRDDIVRALCSVVSPTEISAVFLSHEDADHAGNLMTVLRLAPQAQLVTNYVTVTKLLESTALPLDQVQVVNPGATVSGVDRPLTVVRPPVHDAPGTLGLHDPTSGTVFIADACGAYLPEAADECDEVPEDDLVAGFVTFNTMNHRWTALADPNRLHAAVDEIAKLEPALLLSSHAPPARNCARQLLQEVRRLPAADPYVPPDQAAFERLKPDLGG